MEFDYIVVGAGSAGCALVNRLSGDPDVSVLLLDAGGPDTYAPLHDPNKWNALFGTEVDWGYRTIPQKHTNYSAHYWPRGKVLGGTSSINGMMYLRANREDFDNWAYQGNVGWDYETVLQSFREIETVTDGEPRYHGTDGPLHPKPVTDRNPLAEAFIDAAIEAGHRWNPDLNGATLEGVGWTPMAVHEGHRESSARAFLTPILSRPNLTVLTHALAYQLIVEGTRVRGVRFSREGVPQEAIASREVIACAGVIESPKLLLHSGIGPAGQLEQLGIEPVVDLPGVGENLVDHMLIGVVYECGQTIPPGNEYVTECCLFARSDSRKLSVDLELSLTRENIFAEGFPAPPSCYTIVAEIMRPHSRGWVRLRSDRPEDPPLINPAYLSQESDVRELMAGIELAREIGRAGPLAPWSRGEVVPGSMDLRTYIARAASTSFHPAGTCRMGMYRDCVVDPELRVYGVSGLRVADASIMPDVISCNTNATSTMIGWHAAKLIDGSMVAASTEPASFAGTRA